MNAGTGEAALSAVPRPDLGQTAFFFDFDGTLAPIVDRPDVAGPAPSTVSALSRLAHEAGGAVGILSGRAIDAIDGFLAPLVLPVAGVHGLERRTASGVLHRAAVDPQILAAVADRFEALRSQVPGLIVERKPASVALHYRQAPDRERSCIDLAEGLAQAYAALSIVHGKMVVELKYGAATKGEALTAFMQEAPFQGRRPLFVGDDVTDEDAFEAIARLDSIGIKIGAGATAAGFRAADIDEFLSWLAALPEDRAAGDVIRFANLPTSGRAGRSTLRTNRKLCP